MPFQRAKSNRCRAGARGIDVLLGCQIRGTGRSVPAVPTTFRQSDWQRPPGDLIPGFACSGRVWESTVAALTDVEAHLVTFAGFAGLPSVGGP